MKTLSTFSMIFFFFTLSHGQELSFENPGTPEQRADTLTQKMTTALKLTADQIPVVYGLNLKYAKVAQTEILDKDLSMWSMYMKGSRINKDKEKELKPLLSKEQWKLYKDFKAENRSQMMKKAGM